MDLINELLGLAVLTSPLWFFLILLPVSIWAAVKVAKRFKRVGVRIAAGVSILLLVVFGLIADEIAGKMYFDNLCETEAGVKVYQTVELPAEYWDEKGEAKFLNHKFWVKNLDESDGHLERYSSIFAIDKRITLVKLKTPQKLLAKITTFRYWGGWLRQNLSLHNTANSCKFLNNLNFSQSFYSRLFTPKNNPK